MLGGFRVLGRGVAEAARGARAVGLAGAAADGTLAERAGLLVAALDPCVASAIAIQEGN